MANVLTFASIHKSITQLDQTELPNFVVLTGLNGSGKTHLLTAIANGNVRSSIAPSPQTDVRMFDSTSIIPSDTGVFDPAQNQTQRSQWFNVIQSLREQHLPGLQQFAISQGVPPAYCSSISAVAALSASKLRDILPSPDKAEGIAAAITGQIRQLGSNVYSNAVGQIGDEYWRKAAPKVQQKAPESFFLASQSNFFRDEDFLWGEVDPFKQAFGRVFTTYRELIHDNDRVEKYPPKDDPGRRFLPPEQFIKKFGPPPWDFVNQILEVCRLDFRVDFPPLHETTAYEPKLHKLSIPVEMRFRDLSSGEKVLMSFALCLYNSQEGRQSKVFPKLLLLDEVDAPLHPSMTKSLLATIQDVLVRDKNVAVILTTHSPTTVALAPEAAIYSMNPLGPRVEKTSKSAALSLLTSDVPTLSVAFDGRRQVFVESRSDAGLYDSLFQRYKTELRSERSLVFVEVGRRDQSGGERNAGCSQVERLVDDLASGGNQSVLGLVDWDGHRSQRGRIHVLSAGIRNGLESALFDPILLLAVVAREHIQFGKDRGLFTDADSYIALQTWDQARWQGAADALQNLLLKSASSQWETVDVKYLNGMSIKVAKSYLQMDDHKLEDLIVTTFGFLQPKNKRAGDLMLHIADIVLADLPTLLPKDVLDSMEALLSTDLT